MTLYQAKLPACILQLRRFRIVVATNRGSEIIIREYFTHTRTNCRTNPESAPKLHTDDGEVL